MDLSLKTKKAEYKMAENKVENNKKDIIKFNSKKHSQNCVIKSFTILRFIEKEINFQVYNRTSLY